MLCYVNLMKTEQKYYFWEVIINYCVNERPAVFVFNFQKRGNVLYLFNSCTNCVFLCFVFYFCLCMLGAEMIFISGLWSVMITTMIMMTIVIIIIIIIVIIIIIIIIIRYVCLLSQTFLPGTSLEPAVIPTAHASSFTLQYFPYYVWCSKYSCLL